MTHAAPTPDPVPDSPPETATSGALHHPSVQRRPVAPHVAALAGLATLVIVAVLATLYRHLT